MPAWTEQELATIGDARELEISTRRRDHTLSPKVIIWAVRLGDEIYVRSVNGPTATWYRNTQIRPAGRIWSGGVEHDVGFERADPTLDDQVDDAYRAKFGASYTPTQHIIAPLARQTTMRLTPA